MFGNIYSDFDFDIVKEVQEEINNGLILFRELTPMLAEIDQNINNQVINQAKCNTVNAISQSRYHEYDLEHQEEFHNAFIQTAASIINVSDNSDYDTESTHSSMPGLITDDSSDDTDTTDPNMPGLISPYDSSDSDSDGNGDDRFFPQYGYIDEQEERIDDNIDLDFDINAMIKEDDQKNLSIIDNNLLFDYQRVAFGKEYISGASGFPPYLDENYTAGAYNDRTNKCTSGKIEVNLIANVDWDFNKNKLTHINQVELNNYIEELIGNSSVKIIKGKNDFENKAVISVISNIEFKDDEIEDITGGDDAVIIENKSIQWHIRVPIVTESGEVITIRIFADPGANAACVRTSWALKHFKSFIRRNNKNSPLNTPGGPVTPKYVLWMTFPAKSGLILKAKMYLMDDLPVPILADINMLEAFGYEFKDETPPIFRHPATDDIDLELSEYGNEYKLYNTHTESWFDKYDRKKQSYLKYTKSNNVNCISTTEPPSMYDAIYANDKPIYHHMVGSLIQKEDNEQNDGNIEIKSEMSDFSDLYELNNMCESDSSFETIPDISDMYDDSIEDINISVYSTQGEYINIDNVNQNNTTPLGDINVNQANYAVNLCNSTFNKVDKLVNVINDIDEHDQIEPDYVDRNYRQNENLIVKRIQYNNPHLDRFGNSRKSSPIWSHCLFIMAKQSFLATEEEIEAAKEIHENKELKWNNWDYLKEYPKLYGERYNGLFEGMNKLAEEFEDIFATHTFSRRTMNVEPGRLGIKPEHRNKTMYAPQYPINRDKRLYMINYVIENELNGFWVPIVSSLHCIPYTMVPKKRFGKIYRYRPAFDGRVVNQYCELMPSNMPTIKDFNELHSIRGTTTMADVKNCFDCIPLHVDDQKYAVAMTPLGLYMMLHMTYGWMNAAPVAQKIMNKLSLYVGNCLTYIDDICLKHPFEWGAKEILQHIRRLFEYCKKYNIPLDPSKFFPAATKSISFAIERSIEGRRVSQSYINQILLFAEPQTASQLKEYIGKLSYIQTWIYNCGLFKYWLNQLLENQTDKGKIKWTPQGRLAFQILQEMVRQAPLLYNPTREGQFCIKTDACNYGLGAILYQKQKNLKTGELRWVMVDMWSKVMPRQLRHCHSMVHEAYAIVCACEHWQFHLIKRGFLISTDNKPVATLFSKQWKGINPITQKQLLRLRLKINIFTFDSYHVKGIGNALADSLSRFTTRLYEQQGKKRMLRPINSTDTSNHQLTKRELYELNEYLEEGKQLRKISTELIKGGSINDIATWVNRKEYPNLHSQDCLKDISINSITKNLCLPLTKHQQYESIKSKNNANWNQLMHDYRIHANLVERQRVSDLVNSTQDNLIQTNELELNGTPYETFKDNTKHLLTDIHNMSQSFRDELNTHMHQLQIQMNKESKIISKYESTIAPIINAVDDEYQPTEEEKQHAEKGAPIKQSRMHTRSMTRASKQQQQGDNEEDDFIEKDDHIDVDFQNLRERMKTREEFMHDIFGHRRDLDIFNVEKFKQYQQSDNVLRLVMKLIPKEIEENMNPVDLRFIQRWDPHLASKLLLQQLRIYDGLLQASTYDKVTDSNIWVDVVPFNIRGKLMDYAHHNLQLHHFNWEQTYQSINRKYWWGSMRSDIESFCKTCLPCQFTKGSIRHKAPLVVRQLPKPTEHIFADFLGPIYGDYYILVLVDYATGYTMLIPTQGTDAITVIESILTYWVSIFGWFKTFETDWGSGFNNRLLKTLMKLSGIKVEIAEPRNHRSIGKVERVIGFVQQIINEYNLLLEQRLTNNIDEFEHSWQTIETLLPFIQLALNQRRPRFTTFSPNMLMFGRNVNDISDIDRIKNDLTSIRNNTKVKMEKEDYVYLQDLINKLERINNAFKSDWQEYTWISHENYNKRWNINKSKISRNRKLFTVGKKILYYIGDRQVARSKWKQKWTGPWTIDKRLNDSTIIIGDPETGNQKRVSLDRVKIFSEQGLIKYSNYMKQDENYINKLNKLKEILPNYSADVREQDFDLDYRSRSQRTPDVEK